MKHFFKLLRPHHWSKNLLILLPAAAGGYLGDTSVIVTLFCGIVIFSLSSSCCYIFNDIVDAQHDRAHFNKKLRPIANGDITPKKGFIIVSIGLIAVVVLSFAIHPHFCYLILGYLFCSTAYSLWLKRLFLIDLLVLVVLYTFRVVAGLILSPAFPTAWLFIFIGLLFLSLATLKRHSEISAQMASQGHRLPGRGYTVQHNKIMQTIGFIAGAGANLTLVFYSQSRSVEALYLSPHWLLALPLMLALWLGRAWKMEKRGEMPCDPIVYAIKDPSTYLIAIICTTCLIMAQH